MVPWLFRTVASSGRWLAYVFIYSLQQDIGLAVGHVDEPVKDASLAEGGNIHHEHHSDGNSTEVGKRLQPDLQLLSLSFVLSRSVRSLS